MKNTPQTTVVSRSGGGHVTNQLVGRISDTSNYVLSSSKILVGRISDTSNYVQITSNILLGRISDTSNYVLATSNILVGPMNDTSNYVASAISSTGLYPYFNTYDFALSDNKIVLTKSVGVYQIEINLVLAYNYASILYNYSDRLHAFNKNSSYYTDNISTVTYTMNSPWIKRSILYYNDGDQIMIKNYVKGSTDTYVAPSGNNWVYQYDSLIKMNSGLTTLPNYTVSNADHGFYEQFSWINNEIRGWRAASACLYTPANPSPPMYTITGAYGDQIVYRLEAG